MTTSEVKQPQDRLISKKKPVVRSIRIPTDDEVFLRWESIKSDATVATRLFDSDPTSANATRKERADALLAEAEAQMLENSIKFTFRSIGRRRYEELILKNPITEEGKAKLLAQGNNQEDIDATVWDPDGFARDIIQASCVEPVLTDEDMEEMFNGENWTATELAQLFGKALEVNSANRVFDMGKDSRRTQIFS